MLLPLLYIKYFAPPISFLFCHFFHLHRRDEEVFFTFWYK